jgi:hypothetical protein
MFIHVVLFWLKDPSDTTARQALLSDARELLAKIPGALHVWAGRPAMTPREVVDNSYDVGLCVVLDDRAGHDVYQDHPLHKQFIERNREKWDRVRVYDFA